MKIDIDAIIAEVKEVMMEAVGLLLNMICLQDDKQKADDSDIRFLRREYYLDLMDGRFGVVGCLFGLSLMRRERKSKASMGNRS